MRAEAMRDLKDTRRRERPARRLQAVRGAEPSPGARRDQAGRARRSVRRAAPVLTVAGVLLLAGAGGSWALKRYAASFAVQHVVIAGEFHNAQAQAIEQALTPHVKGDFFTVDLAAARRAVSKLEWVRGATLRREWPNRVVVGIEEQVPVARWNDGRFINRHGEVFGEAYGADLERLPVLKGPSGHARDVYLRWLELQQMVSPAGLSVAGLSLDRRGSWMLRTGGGVVLRLGSDALEQRLARLLEVLTSGTAPGLERVEAIDLRYSNGFAVDWKEQSGAAQTGGQTGETANEVRQDV